MWKDTYQDDQALLQLGLSVPTRRQQAEISYKAGQEEESTQAYHAGLGYKGGLRGSPHRNIQRTPRIQYKAIQTYLGKDGKQMIKTVIKEVD